MLFCLFCLFNNELIELIDMRMMNKIGFGFSDVFLYSSVYFIDCELYIACFCLFHLYISITLVDIIKIEFQYKFCLNYFVINLICAALVAHLVFG